MPRTFPRVLRLRWNQCASTQPELRSVRNGEAEVTMLTAGFAPENVVGLRLGNAAGDFTEEVDAVYPDQSVHQVWTLNLRMTGLIPMIRSLGNFGVFTGPFAYELTGFFDAAARFEFPDGTPAFDSHFRILAEHVIATGSLEYTSPAQNHYISETNLLWGTTTTTFFQPPPLGALQTVSSYEGLRLRDETDFASFTTAIAIDGKLNYQPMPAPFGLPDGCVGGDLVYRTRVPLAGPAFGEITSGELLLNHSATAKFYSAANVPPTLPFPTRGLLLRFELRGAGSFDHDTASVFETLRQVGQCLSP